ncbi:MAG: oligoendopeptidase F, partial [Pseudomonadota bacterium]
MADMQAEALGDLPNWDLDDLYPGRDSDALKGDLSRIETEANGFRDRYRGTLAALDGAGLGEAIAVYEALQDTMGRIMSFAQLAYSGNVTDPEVGKFYQTMQERVTTISSELIFFTLELNELDDDVLNAKLSDPAAAKYAPWLRDVRAFR